jgi:hypothetical protein
MFSSKALSVCRTRLPALAKSPNVTKSLLLARHASNRARSFYNTDISGLTEEQEEVCFIVFYMHVG